MGSLAVLSNEQLRAAYDREGAEAAAVAEAPVIDPALFFNVLFGSEKFEPYVGRLKLSHVASAFGDIIKSASEAGDGAAGEEGGPGAAGLPDLASQLDDGDRALRVQNLREVRRRATDCWRAAYCAHCVRGHRAHAVRRLSSVSFLIMTLPPVFLLLPPPPPPPRGPRLHGQGGGGAEQGRLWAPDAGRGAVLCVCGGGGRGGAVVRMGGVKVLRARALGFPGA